MVNQTLNEQYWVKPGAVILLCPMSSLERATARPLYELRARDVDAMIVQR